MAEVESTGRFAGLFDEENCADQRSTWIGNYDYRALCMVDLFLVLTLLFVCHRLVYPTCARADLKCRAISLDQKLHTRIQGRFFLYVITVMTCVPDVLCSERPINILLH